MTASPSDTEFDNVILAVDRHGCIASLGDTAAPMFMLELAWRQKANGPSWTSWYDGRLHVLVTYEPLYEGERR